MLKNKKLIIHTYMYVHTYLDSYLRYIPISFYWSVCMCVCTHTCTSRKICNLLCMGFKLIIKVEIYSYLSILSEEFINYRDLTENNSHLCVLSFGYKKNKRPLNSIQIEVTELLGQFGSKSSDLQYLPWSVFKTPLLWATACSKG